jgi:NitT/TauT family transport system ATP-binding protein
MIEIMNIGKAYQTKTRKIYAISNITIKIEKGQFVSIVGPSGCGKSTLLHMIAGFTEPTTGSIKVNNQLVNSNIPKGLGYIFQKDTVLPWYSVRKNIALGLRYRGKSKTEIKEKVDSLLRIARLKEFENEYPHHLSGGMRRRLALLMTLACDPSILLLDEPFGALDTHTKTLLHAELLEIWLRDKQTILMVTHDLGEALTLSDRVIVLSSAPSNVLLDQPVNIEHPRDVFTLRESDDFSRHFQALWRVLGREFKTSSYLDSRK